MKTQFLNAFTVVLIVLLKIQSISAQIVYDNSFDQDGRFLYNESGTEEYFVTTLLQSDGKIIGIGETNYDPDEASNFRILVFRLNTNGTPDASFGPNGNGRVYIDTPNSTDEASTAILQSDGKILIAGTKGSQGTVYRLNTNGTMDNTFGASGKAQIAAESGYYFFNIKLQTDGKIVVSGRGFVGSYSSYVIARFNTNGQLDNTFNSSGYHKFRTSTLSTEEDDGAGYGLTIQSDGKIVSCGFDEKENGTIVRLNANGTLDQTWGYNGAKIVDFTRDLFLYSVIIDCDGKIVAGGTYDYSSSLNKAIILRFFENSNFDNSFNSVGFNWYGNDFGTGYEVTLQCDCKYLIGGSDYLARVKLDGDIDQAFANNGHFNISFDFYPSLQRSIILNANKIYLSGYYYAQSAFVDKGCFVIKLNNDINCGSVLADDLEKSISIEVNPNPAVDLITIQLNDDDNEIIDVSITDNLGRMIISNDKFYSVDYGLQCNIAMQPRGAYFVVVTTARGRRVLPLVKV